jgi:signal transduction histidine kinase
VIAGVAGGLGSYLGVDPVIVRIGFVVLSMAGGVGVVAYGLLWLLLPVTEAERATARASVQQAVALGLMMLGVLLFLRAVGLWFGDALVWPVVLAAVGSAVAWTRSDRDTWTGNDHEAAPGTGRMVLGKVSPVRVALGAVLVAGGVALFLAAQDTFGAARQLGLAVVAAIAGVLLLFGPWLKRMLDALTAERRERVRQEERAELAAHLHDSVLQTLALIQRSDDPRETATLARTQERDLRAWLYGTGAPAGSLRAAVEEAAAALETRHRTPIDVVVVGDTPLDGPLQALVQAASEAMANAARHAQADRVSVYVEVEADAVTAYVTDQGVGFDPAAVPADRRGIAESIRGRMARHGGEATVLAEPGEGTEVALRLPRPAPMRGQP